MHVKIFPNLPWFKHPKSMDGFSSSLSRLILDYLKIMQHSTHTNILLNTCSSAPCEDMSAIRWVLVFWGSVFCWSRTSAEGYCEPCFQQPKQSSPISIQQAPTPPFFFIVVSYTAKSPIPHASRSTRSLGRNKIRHHTVSLSYCAKDLILNSLNLLNKTTTVAIDLRVESKNSKFLNKEQIHLKWPYLISK